MNITNMKEFEAQIKETQKRQREAMAAMNEATYRMQRLFRAIAEVADFELEIRSDETKSEAPVNTDNPALEGSPQ